DQALVRRLRMIPFNARFKTDDKEAAKYILDIQENRMDEIGSHIGMATEDQCTGNTGSTQAAEQKTLIEDSLVSSIESNPKLSSSQSESADRHPGYKLKARYAAKWCYVSTSSSISVRVAELLVFEGTVNKSWCPRGMLVDGGASCSFIDESFARTLNCDQWQLPKPLVIKTANGGKVECSHVIAAAEIGIEGHVGCHDLIVIPHLDEFDVVLGRTLLESSKAVVQHEHGTISWPNDPCTANINPIIADTTSFHTNPWHVLSPEDSLEAPSIDSNAAVTAEQTIPRNISCQHHHKQHAKASKHHHKQHTKNATLMMWSLQASSTPHHHRSCQSMCRHHHLRFRSQQQRLKHSSVFVSGSPRMSIE
ncbi:MAG TPA: retropepsin-like aspartic protease, partial [Allocoleopsis sp.]